MDVQQCCVCIPSLDLVESLCTEAFDQLLFIMSYITQLCTLCTLCSLFIRSRQHVYIVCTALYVLEKLPLFHRLCQNL